MQELSESVVDIVYENGRVCRCSQYLSDNRIIYLTFFSVDFSIACGHRRSIHLIPATFIIIIIITLPYYNYPDVHITEEEKAKKRTEKAKKKNLVSKIILFPKGQHD